MSAGGALLRVEGVRRSYGPRLVLDVDALEVGSGEVLAVLGPNGAGKSTLLRILLLLERPDAGRVLWKGRPVRPGDRVASREMAGVFQRPYLFAGSVARNAAYALRVRGAGRAERERVVAEALELVGLSALAGADARTLSGGEAQRLGLARALVVAPELLLLDEPTAALDVTVRRRFREDLERLLRTRAQSAVLVTHDPADAFALADRVAVLQAGRVVQTATPAELVLDPATPFVAAFTGAELLLNGRMGGREHGLLGVEVGEATVWVAETGETPPAARGEPVHVSYRAEDVLLSAATDEAETSARNRLRVRVEALVPAGGLVRVRLTGAVSLAALVTRPGAEALGLAPGVEVVAQLKATALHVFPAGARGPGT